MSRMTGYHVGESAHRKRIVAGDAAPIPCVVRERIDEGQCCVANRFEFLDVASKRSFVSTRAKHANILIKARQRTVEPPSEPERPAGENSLTVIHMTHDLADAPLARL